LAFFFVALSSGAFFFSFVWAVQSLGIDISVVSSAFSLLVFSYLRLNWEILSVNWSFGRLVVIIEGIPT